jgi:predicted small secreted protein
MKKGIVILFVALVTVLAGCATSHGASQSKQQKRQQVAAAIAQRIDNRHFKVDVNYAYPLGHRSINLTSSYSLEIAGDSVISYLPYYGQAYNVPYGGGKALNFTGTMSRYNVSNPKSDLTVVEFYVTNEEDTYQYYVEIYNNGTTNITVTSTNRESIRFSGRVNGI